MIAVLLVTGAYLVGTIPSPYLIALAARRRDVVALMRRRESQGDAHFLVGTRIGRVAGVASIVLDMGKGFGPALAVSLLFSARTAAAAGLAAVVGHCFPPYARRSGGRGLSTAAGVALALVPLAMIPSGVIALAGTVAGYGGLGTSVGFALLPVFALALGYRTIGVIMCAAIILVIAVRRLEGLGDDRRSGAETSRILLSRLLMDLPRGERR